MPKDHHDDYMDPNYDPDHLLACYEDLGPAANIESLSLGAARGDIEVKDYVLVESPEHKQYLKAENILTDGGVVQAGHESVKKRTRAGLLLWKAFVTGIRQESTNRSPLVEVKWCYTLAQAEADLRKTNTARRLKTLTQGTTAFELFVSTHRSVLQASCIQGTIGVTVFEGYPLTKNAPDVDGYFVRKQLTVYIDGEMALGMIPAGIWAPGERRDKDENENENESEETDTDDDDV